MLEETYNPIYALHELCEGQRSGRTKEEAVVEAGKSIRLSNEARTMLLIVLGYHVCENGDLERREGSLVMCDRPAATQPGTTDGVLELRVASMTILAST